MRKRLVWPALLLVAALTLVGCTGGSAPSDQNTAPGTGGGSAPAGGQSRLDLILSRGKLLCGANDKLPGFGYVTPDGKFAGFDVDFCRAIAAALFDNPDAVEFKPLSASERFTAVQTGAVDVLIRNTTWTLTRDSQLGLEFAAVTFYDGQGMMVRKDSGITRLEDFEGRSVCVQAGTTTELNLADQMRKRGVNYQSVVFDDADATLRAYDEGRCDGFTTDKSGLATYRTQLKNPDEHVILDVTMSKEPLGPAVLAGDHKWSKVVKWVVFATMEAEELGITSRNVDQLKASSQDPAVRRFLGLEGEFGKHLGLSNDWAYRIIKHVGNYGEIYDRNLGPNTPFKLERGLNDLWTRGGLIYPPPLR